jgi:monoamine oxidase
LPVRVAVVGGGIAGLAAADVLHDRGFEVVVLEARDRIGGRIHTVDGVDLGAHWIHSTEGNPIAALARRFNADTIFVGGDSTYTGGWDHLRLCDADGRTLNPDEKLFSILVADEVRDRLDALRRQRAAANLPDLAIRDALALAIEGMDLSDEARVAVEWHVALSARDDCAAELDSLSFMWWDDGYEVYGYGDSVFARGYQVLTTGLAEGLDIRLAHVVREIHHGGANGRPVQIVTNHGVIDADVVIVTLPLGVLKAGGVSFVPPLPAAKQAAIDRLGMGALTKVVAWFDEPFWDRHQYVVGRHRLCLRDGSPTTVLNLWATHRLPALVIVIGGETARAIESASNQATRDWATAVVRDVFGTDAAVPARVAVTGWNGDPYSRGAYSFITHGASPADLEVLAEPVGDTLLFAGEHTNRHHWGCAHGAYTSGLREAARIAGDPSIVPPRHFTENKRWRDMMLRASRFFNLVSRSIETDEMRRRLGVLQASDVFSIVPEAEIKVLAPMFQTATFESGGVICREGDTANQVFVIADGDVDIVVGGRSVARLGRGGVFGEYGMFEEGVRTATVVAHTPTSLLTLDYQRFRSFLLAFPEAMLALMKLTVNRLLAAQRSPTANR